MGAGAEASERAQARARAGILCSARASVRASVLPSALPHRVCGGRRLRRLICPRSRGGWRRPIRSAGALMDGPRPRPQYCSCPPRPQPPPRGNAAGGGDPGDPCNEGTGDPCNVGAASEEGALRAGNPWNSPHRGGVPRGRGVACGRWTPGGGSPINHRNEAGAQNTCVRSGRGGGGELETAWGADQEK